MEPSTHALRSFLSVAQHQHFGHAASELHVSGPALSQLIRRLERDLNVELFERNTRNVRLTVAGHELVDHARRVVRAADDLDRWRRDRAVQGRRRIHFAFTVNGAGDLMAAILRAVRTELVTLDVEPRQVRWPDLPDVVLNGSFDVAIARGPRDFGEAVFTPVLSDPWVAVLPADHPLARRACVDYEQLREERFILPEIGARERRPQWLGGPSPDGCTPPVGPAAANLEEALDHVQVGDGVFVIGETSTSLYPRPQVRYVPLTGLAPGFIGLLTAPAQAGDPDIEAFVMVVSRVAARVHPSSATSTR